MIFQLYSRVLKHVEVTIHTASLMRLFTVNIVVFDLVDKIWGALNHMMPSGWIGSEEPVAWPPKSPDLNKFDYFFFCGVVLRTSSTT